MAETTAQGLVRFEASGQIQPALAQRWIVSDDGLRYTFRLARLNWVGGEKITAAQVVARLRAAMSTSSRNALKPLLGAIDELQAMTDDVVEISLKSPRPNFLQLLAQPELAIIHDGSGSGPYQASEGPRNSVLLSLQTAETEDDGSASDPELLVRAERASLAAVRFRLGLVDYVAGGTLGDLVIARGAEPPVRSWRFDPVAGLFGLIFLNQDGILGVERGREALSMGIDRQALVAALAVPNLQPRATLLPPGIAEMPQPSVPSWASIPFVGRRSLAAGTISDLANGKPIVLRVALPPGPGYRIAFAYLRASWNAIGVKAEAVGENDRADVRLVDRVAPVTMASWYLRNFTCEVSRVCSADADRAMDLARIAPSAAERRVQLAEADRLLTATTPFIPIAAPVRWSLVSDRLNGFQLNSFGRHAADQLVATRR
jgi:peptide/nickel transport system substrate-binding protein